MKRTLISVTAVAAALAMTACVPTAGASDSGEPRGSNTSSSTYTPDESLVDDPADAEAAAESSEAPDANEPTPFGSTFTYEDGVSISVSEPTTFTPSEWAAGGEGFDEWRKVTVRIVNDSGTAFDPSLAMISASSGPSEADEVFDDGLEGAPTTQVLDGREVSFDVGFGVADPSDLVVQVAPSWDHDAALFTTSAG